MFRRVKQELKEGKTLLQFGFLKAVGQALGMIAPLVVAKFFSPELFGRYSLAKMIVFFFTSLLIASAQTPIIVFASQERAETGKISKSFSVQCMFLALSMITFLLINSVFSKAIIKFTQISPTGLLFMSLAFAGIAVKTFLNILFMALGQRIKSSLAELVFGSLIFALIVVLCLIDKISLETVFLVYFASGILVVTLFIKTVDFHLLLPFDFDWKHFKDMFNSIKWIMLSATAVYFINWGDNLVLRPFVSMEDIGVYNLGYQIFKGTVMLTLIISVYFLPFVSEHIEDSTKMKNYLYNKRPKIFLVGLIAIIILFALIPYILRLIYGDTYTGSVNIIRILLIGSVLALYGVFYGPILNALKKYKFIQTAVTVQVLLNVLLNLILVPRMGLYGAAVATAFAYFCNIVTIEVYFRVKLKKLLKI